MAAAAAMTELLDGRLLSMAADCYYDPSPIANDVVSKSRGIPPSSLRPSSPKNTHIGRLHWKSGNLNAAHRRRDAQCTGLALVSLQRTVPGQKGRH